MAASSAGDESFDEAIIPDSGDHDSMGNIIIPETQLTYSLEIMSNNRTNVSPPSTATMDDDLQFVGFSEEIDMPSTDEINEIMKCQRAKKRKIHNSSSVMNEIDHFPDSNFSTNTKDQATSNGMNYSSVLNNDCIPKTRSMNSPSIEQNITQDSNSNNLTIIIEPMMSLNGESTDLVLKKFFSNDKSLNSSLYDSLLGRCNISNVTKNLKRNLLVVQIDRTSTETLDQILKISSLNNFKVNCRLPREEQTVRGVIGPIGVDTLIEDIKEELQMSHPEIINIERIVRGKDKTPTLTIKLTFKGRSLPNEIILWYQKFRVSTYVGRPWQCYNCQKFGHNANICRSKTVCATCAGPHKTFNCTQADLPLDQKTMKCINCNENHSANYGGCLKIKMAKEIEKKRAFEGLTYKQALLRVKETSENRPSQTNIQKNMEIPSSRVNYINKPEDTNRSDTQPNPIPPKLTRTSTSCVSTQTESSDAPSEKLLSQLSLLIVKLIQLKTNETDIVIKTVEEVTGVKIDPNKIEENKEEKRKTVDKNPEREEKNRKSNSNIREKEPTTSNQFTSIKNQRNKRKESGSQENIRKKPKEKNAR